MSHQYPPCAIPQPADQQMVTYAISDNVVLAGQPQPDDWARLVEQGFRTVINIRSDPEKAAAQARAAEAVGLRYIYLPVPAYLLEPEHLAAFHEAMQAQTGKILLHCRSATRVALLWMLERVVYDGWTPEQAQAALRDAGYTDEKMEALVFCADDYFDRAIYAAQGETE